MTRSPEWLAKPGLVLHYVGEMTRTGRPSKSSLDEVQKAALEIVDRKGLEALSMRALAARLGTGTMTLYNYVSDRESLEILVVDAVLADIVLPSPSSDDWRKEVRGIVVAIWQAVRSHPYAIPLILIRRNRSTALLQIAEALLAALARSGRSGYQLLLAFRIITSFVAGFIEADLSGPILAAAGESTATITDRTRQLPQNRYPRLIELATAAVSSDPTKEFLDALDELLDRL